MSQVTTSIASYVGHDPAHAMDGVHQVATLLGGWIGAVTLTGAPASAPLLRCCFALFVSVPPLDQQTLGIKRYIDRAIPDPKVQM